MHLKDARNIMKQQQQYLHTFPPVVLSLVLITLFPGGPDLARYFVFVEMHMEVCTVVRRKSAEIFLTIMEKHGLIAPL